MNKSMWSSEAVKAYESGQGVVLVEKPYPHYEPVAYADNGVVNWIADKQFMHEAELYTAPPLRTWAEFIRGVRVDGDTVVITAKGGNKAARLLCGALIEEMNK